MVINTPYGPSPPLTQFTLRGGKRVISCRMHGWRGGHTRLESSLQVFWCFREAGVRQILSEGGVGTIHESWEAGSIVIPDDYIDWSLRRDASLSHDYLLIMRDPLCASLRQTLAAAVRASLPEIHLVEGGVYAVTDGRHFESRAEVRALKTLGADIIGQSLAPEVYLAREIGACYAGLHQVVNRAEGIGEDWSHRELRELFHGRAPVLAHIMMSALAALPSPEGCACLSLRKKTILKEGGRAAP